MGIKQLLKLMVEQNASDLFFRAGGTPRLRVDGILTTLDDKILSVNDVMQATETLTTPKQREIFKNNSDVDFALYLEDLGQRFRINIFMQRNWP